MSEKLKLEEFMKRILLISLMVLASGCAVLHRVNIASIDSKTVLEGHKFEVFASEVGVNVNETADTAKVFTGSKKTQDDIEAIKNLINLFQMGPRTGNPIYNQFYADKLATHVMAKCPSGKISGLMSIRETADYKVASGEIVKITGYCLTGKGVH
jgi:hypothetical protein